MALNLMWAMALHSVRHGAPRVAGERRAIPVAAAAGAFRVHWQVPISAGLAGRIFSGYRICSQLRL